jgi:hypothetical protein
MPTAPIDEPLPEGSAVLVAHAVLKSEDGKHTVQLATFGFPMSKKDREGLMGMMGSDPYWDGFRVYFAYLRVGDKDIMGGPRLLTWGRFSPFLADKEKEKLPRYEWTATFVVPADVKLTGTELKFYHHKPEQPFAKLEITEKELKAAALPFRAAIKETGTYRKAHYVLFSTNYTLNLGEIRLGEAKPREHIRSIYYDDKKYWRHQWQDEWIPAFEEPPPADAPVLMKFHGVEGWYRAETVVEKPKEKK